METESKRSERSAFFYDHTEEFSVESGRFGDFLGGPVVKNPVANARVRVRSLIQEGSTHGRQLSPDATTTEA